jgi:hypothetical protein
LKNLRSATQRSLVVGALFVLLATGAVPAEVIKVEVGVAGMF